MDNGILNYLFLALCFGASFLLSGMEAGVFALNRLRIRRLARNGKPSAQILNGFLEKPERFLWTILVGNTLANFIILGWILTRLHEWSVGRNASAAVLALFAVIVFLFYAFFDLLPKMLFRAYPNSLCLSAARVFRIINFLLSPLVVMVEDVSKVILHWSGGQVFKGQLFGNREEMRAVMRESGQTLTDDEHAMVNRILDLQNYTVGQIAKPLAQTVAVEAQTPLRDALTLAREKSLSRLPVWEIRDRQRRVAGMLDVGPLLYRDSLDVEKPAAAYMIPAVFVNEGIRLEVALRLMQRAGQRVAIVLSRERKEVGIVALKDILKVMFGEMKL
ncbi:MAG: CNNM domain-containing protein [Verrucomicrobiota bacterium]|jgi:putative hemolysin